MSKSEISKIISQLEGNIAVVEKRRTEAENNIRQLEALNASCSNYQTEFEFARTARRIRLEDFDQMLGQARLVRAYDAVLQELLNGSEYTRAYGNMDMAKSEISREIERQKQVIMECNGQMAEFNSSIGDWRQQLASADKEIGDAGYTVNYR